MKRKNVLLFVFLPLTVLIGFLILFTNTTTVQKQVVDKNYHTVTDQDTKKFTSDMDNMEQEENKAEAFIVSMLHNEDSLLEFHLHEEVETNKELPDFSSRDETLLQFLTSLKTEDPLLFEGAFEATAITTAFSEDFMDYTKEGINEEFLRMINIFTRNGTYTDGDFTFSGSQEGYINLNYKDGSSFKIPFNLNEYTDGHKGESENYYLIGTPVADMLEIIKEKE